MAILPNLRTQLPFSLHRMTQMRTLLIALGLTIALPVLSLAQSANEAPAAAQPQAQVTPADTATPAATAPAAQASAALTGNVEKGKQLTYTCLGCHGIDGYRNAYPNYRVPKIGGQSQTYLSNALHAYANGTREHPTMQVQAENYSEQDIADIAAFLSQVNK